MSLPAQIEDGLVLTGADRNVGAGKDKAILYRRGRRLRTVPAEQIVQVVLEEVRSLQVGAKREI